MIGLRILFCFSGCITTHKIQNFIVLLYIVILATQPKLWGFRSTLKHWARDLKFCMSLCMGPRYQENISASFHCTLWFFWDTLTWEACLSLACLQNPTQKPFLVGWYRLYHPPNIACLNKVIFLVLIYYFNNIPDFTIYNFHVFPCFYGL